MSKNSELVEKYQSGDEKAADELVENNMGLVYSIVRRFSNVSCESEDLVQIGAIGLIKAVNTFSPEKNIKLATYASRCIENEILMFFRANKKHRNTLLYSWRIHEHRTCYDHKSQQREDELYISSLLNLHYCPQRYNKQLGEQNNFNYF